MHRTVQIAQAINTPGIQQWVAQNIVPLLLLVIGVGIISKARKGNWSDTMNTSGIAIIGIIFIVGAAGFMAFGKEMSGLVFGG